MTVLEIILITVSLINLLLISYSLINFKQKKRKKPQLLRIDSANGVFKLDNVDIGICSEIDIHVDANSENSKSVVTYKGIELKTEVSKDDKEPKEVRTTIVR